MGKKKNTKQQKRKQQKAQRRKKRQAHQTAQPQYPTRERILSDWKDELQENDGFEDAEFVLNPEGEAKMSDALVDIMGEYAEIPDTQDEMERLLYLTAAAWNAALPVDVGAKNMLDDILAMADGDSETLAEIETVFTQMMIAKRTLHPHNHRYILDVKVVDRGDNFHISVISNLTPPN